MFTNNDNLKKHLGDDLPFDISVKLVNVPHKNRFDKYAATANIVYLTIYGFKQYYYKYKQYNPDIVISYYENSRWVYVHNITYKDDSNDVVLEILLGENHDFMQFAEYITIAKIDKFNKKTLEINVY